MSENLITFEVILIFEAITYCNIWKVQCPLLLASLAFFGQQTLCESGLQIIHLILNNIYIYIYIYIYVLYICIYIYMRERERERERENVDIGGCLLVAY